MSIGDWLDRQREKKKHRTYRKHKKHIKTKFGQGEDRQRAVQYFTDLGKNGGYEGLLERFMVNVEPSIKDEDEKEYVYEILVEFGQDVIPAIEAYLNRKDAAHIPITWPLKVLAAVAETKEAVRVIVDSLEKIGTSYTREPERKVLLVSQLVEYDDPRVVPTLIPFLRDHRDEVQLEALAALEKKADESAREEMLKLLTEEDTPARIRSAIAETMKKLGLSVKGFRKKVEDILPDGLHVDRSGRIKGRWVHAMVESDDEES
ncbi:MAG: HEAT repeat domain-containing protein [Deltaproteobacteria bacterium]|nr:HEAT repeat domain-containing protein [Deltaproteobacteria bacterium]MBW1872416.1 HEAT repeat domain-containing protein [Deltaproteobacteria bacterium]